MLDKGKHNLLGSNISACDYEYVLKVIKERSQQKRNLLIFPAASHPLTQAFSNKSLRNVLKKYDYIVPDSQWVRWSIKFLYGVSLKDRVYGPTLFKKVCKLSEKKRYKVFLYGTTRQTLGLLVKNLKKKYPKIKLFSRAPPNFADLGKNEKEKLISEIQKCKADILFIGLGSPAQIFFAHNLIFRQPAIIKPLVIIPVGAAFDFVSGVKPQAPKWMQDWGLEWFYRLVNEPRRLVKRYLVYGTAFALLVIAQKLSLLPRSTLSR